jgi:signal transduction histidine kinase
VSEPEAGWLRQLDLGVLAAVPLVLRGSVLGVLVIACRAGGGLPERAITAVQRLTRQTVIALENRRLYTVERRRAREAEALLAITRAATSSLRFTPLLGEVTRRTAQALEVDRCTIVLWDGGRIEAVASQFADGRRDRPRWRALRRLRRTPARDILPLEALAGAPGPIVFSAATGIGILPGRIVDAFGLTEGALVPLRRHGALIGLLCLDNLQRGALLDEGQLRLAAIVADQLALALENAKLYAEREQSAQDEERRRIAYELHDGIAQLIVASRQSLERCQALWEAGAGDAGAELARALERIDGAITETRRVLMALSPAVVHAVGLVEAVRRHVDDLAHDCGWSVDFRASVADARLPPDVETTVFRIAQEALANVRQHAHATRVQVSLERTGAWLQLTIRDNGIGLPEGPPRQARRGMGLSSMHERAARLGGRCRLEARQPGVQVTLRLPLPPDASSGG